MRSLLFTWSNQMITKVTVFFLGHPLSIVLMYIHINEYSGKFWIQLYSKDEICPNNGASLSSLSPSILPPPPLQIEASKTNIDLPDDLSLSCWQGSSSSDDLSPRLKEPSQLVKSNKVPPNSAASSQEFELDSLPCSNMSEFLPDGSPNRVKPLPSSCNNSRLDMGYMYVVIKTRFGGHH